MAGAGLHHCDHCPATFATARAKASHQKVHSKGVKCEICGEEVRYIAAHVRRDHSGDALVQLEIGVGELVAEVRVLRRENARLTKIVEAG